MLNRINFFPDETLKKYKLGKYADIYTNTEKNEKEKQAKD